MPEDGLPYLRHDRAAELTLDAGSLSTQDGRITDFSHDESAEIRVDASGCAIVPGFVDAHTHLPFVGWRAEEYAQRVGGTSYEELAALGGGIAASARAFAEASDDAVLEQSGSLAHEMLMHGTTAFECKSGYGLSIEAELRALRLAMELDKQVEQHTVSTALLVHAVPPGLDADTWIDQVKAAMPEIRDKTAAQAVDIFVETVAFSNKHLEHLADCASEFGLMLRCHVEQFATHHSVPVAPSVGARSVDHLTFMHADDRAKLADAECAAVLLPGAEFLGEERCPRARELAHAGAICVLGTDLNPGTSPIISIPLIIGLAVRRYSWSIREALLAVSLNAAWTLGLSAQIGSLEVGKQADFLLLDGPVEEIPYRFGRNPVAACFIAGRPVYVRPDAKERFELPATMQ